MLLTFFGQDEGPANTFAGGTLHCYVDYWEDGAWIAHLSQSLPAGLQSHVRFRPVAEAVTLNQTLVYPAGTGAIQIRTLGRDADGPHYKIWIWHPGNDGNALAANQAHPVLERGGDRRDEPRFSVGEVDRVIDDEVGDRVL